MRCQNCGADLDHGVEFCRECGSKVNRKIFCRECGEEVTLGIRFCSNCGSDMSIVERFATKGDEHGTTASNYNTRLAGEKNVNRTTQRKYQSKKMPNANMGDFIQKQAKNNKTIVFIAIVAGVVILLIGLISLVGGKIKKAKNSMDIIPTFTSTQTSDFTIELNSQYAYMSDEWNVYIAEAVTDSVIKIERWNKTSSSDKKVKLRDGVGSFKINDSENGFAWVDDEHTAFTFRLKDKNNSRVKGQTVVFTININEDDKNKGSDYNPQIACYSYQNDDWHNYRAIPLTDDLVKIETWSRGSSIGKFLFGYDMCVLNTNSADTDFEMNSDKTAFTVTIIDQDNDYYWKEKKFVSFTLEDSDYQYPNVWSYRDSNIAHEGEIAISTGASTYKYKDYHEVQSMLESEGLTNISTIILYDIIWGWTAEGEVDCVSIDGDDSFNAGDIFKAEAPVVITYHMKYEDNPDNTSMDVQ